MAAATHVMFQSVCHKVHCFCVDACVGPSLRAPHGRPWQSLLDRGMTVSLCCCSVCVPCFLCVQDPLAIIGLTAIFLPFVLLLVAIATGLVDVSVYR